ncbi:hypothetical protein MNBD_GAMMA11-2762 [hydrothermal vent metagenome]|uniref:Uncharacterized protein n=1 Tax=hydrothermal vent metagenome TaxID=652676 RepID=A0A3B0X9T1_9ZZZZ
MRDRWIPVSDKTAVQLTVAQLFSCKIFIVLPALLMVLLVSSCACVQPVKTQPGILPVADNKGMPSVISSLMVQADEQYMQGEYEAALATLERAVRIKPRYAEIWSRMAQIYAQKGDSKQAKQHAERSSSYIKNNPALKKFNDSFIQADE